MTLVDLPGYGPAATKASVRTKWARATRRYLRERTQLACAFVVVDATLGITADDERFLDILDDAGVEYHGVLTKADLLTPRELAQSYELIRRRVATRTGYAGGDMPMCSSRNAAGVAALWHRMRLGILQVKGELDSEEVLPGMAEDDGDDVAAEDDGVEAEAEEASTRGARTKRRRKRRRATSESRANH